MLIGLCGFARSGKSVAASILQERHGFSELSFASPIREFIRGLLMVDMPTFETIKDKPHPLLSGKSPRFAMQTLGTEWGRHGISSTLWVDVCIQKARALMDSGTYVVVSDVRFDNEARAIRDAGGIIIRLHRSDIPRILEATHESESGITDTLVDIELHNNQDIQELHHKLQSILMFMRNKQQLCP